MKTKTIKQKVVFDATPEEIYDLLMNAEKHAAFTQASAQISDQKGKKFSLWDDYITGKNLELERGKKIMQEWWCSDLPEGHITLVTYSLKALKNKTTELNFTQTNVPTDQYDALFKGWEDFYWTPMKTYLSENAI